MRFFEMRPMPPLRVRLTHSRKKLMRWLRLFDADAHGVGGMLDGNANALTAQVQTDAGMVCIVYVSPDSGGELADDAGLLAHEATHVSRFYFEDVNEGEPSDELEAYTVQAVTAYLCGEHFKWLNAQGTGRTPKPCGRASEPSR